MKNIINFASKNAVAGLLGFLAVGLSGRSQICQVTNWVNDPFCENTNYVLAGGNSSSPCFANNGVQRGTLFTCSPLSSTLKLEHPGDTVSFTGTASIGGDVNPTGNLQFRLGLYYRGTSHADTNWLGYTLANVTVDSGAAKSLLVLNNPNPGIFTSAAPGVSMRPPGSDIVFAPGWAAGTYEFALAITQLAGNFQKIAWKLDGVDGNSYRESGTYTNTLALTAPTTFDHVGMMSGAAMFQSATSADSLSLSNLNVTLVKAGEQH